MQEKRKKATTTKSVLDTFPGFTSAFHFHLSVRGAEMGSTVSGGPALELPPAWWQWQRFVTVSSLRCFMAWFADMVLRASL